MSIAATRSHQGDEYQLLVAMHWLIQLLRPDGKIAFMQIESNGIPGDARAVVVDDVVVEYQNGQRDYIQIKKNQPDRETWRIQDATMQEELGKARQQLEENPHAFVRFYSRSPFGALQKLAEDILMFPDHAAFERTAPDTLKNTLSELCKLWEREPQLTFGLASRLGYAISRDFDEWEQVNRDDLAPLVPRADDALRIFEKMLAEHQTKRRIGTKHIIRRRDLLDRLAEEGIYPTPCWDEQKNLALFAAASRIGREWVREVDGHRFTRQAVTELYAAIQQRAQRIVLTDGPGTGKTCVLLDLMERLEREPGMVPLFIRGEFFDAARTESELTDRGLPDEMVGRCARLAENRQVVVLVDSLDVLSLQRDHGALTLFLGLMDRMAQISGLSLIVACRRFDLAYHSHLRGRKWDVEITIGLLDWQSDVVPMLNKWGVEPDGLSPDLQKALLVPQNLLLFHGLKNVAALSSLRSAYQLNNLFLHHLVDDDPQLGEAAMDALQNMAQGMMEQRDNRVSISSWRGPSEVRQRLISKGILYEAGAGGFAFTHQTLRDNLLVRGALRDRRDLTAFIGSWSPLPFVRPVIRAFVLHLVVVRPRNLGQQVIRVLNDQQVPDHIRRLIAETLAEIDPEPDADWLWINQLFQTQPKIFGWIFRKAYNGAWFRLLHDKWLPTLARYPDRERWRLELLSRLDVWVNRFPAECIALWLDGLNSTWALRGVMVQVLWNISIGLDRFTHWSLPESRTILEQLVKMEDSQERRVGVAISRYVATTNQGDDLLWAFICADVKPDNVNRLEFDEILHCSAEFFQDDTFLEQRLVASEPLLEMAIAALEKWAGWLSGDQGAEGLVADYVRETSWRLRHKNNEQYAISLSVLLDGLEAALISHVDGHTAWWQSNEPRLRKCRSLALRYLLILAYTRHPERQAEGIGCQLVDETLLRQSVISYAVGQLVNAAAPYVESRVLDGYQRAVLNQFEATAEEYRGSFPVIYRYSGLLFWIPCIFRIAEVQAFLDRHAPPFGHTLPEPEIWSAGGFIQPPISVEMINALSKEGMIRFLRHYENVEHSAGRWDWLVGGKESVEHVLHDAASLNPLSYLALLAEEELEKGYVDSIINGVVSHVRHRFGNLQPATGWTPVEPLPNAELLARRLLDLLVWHPEWLWHGLIGSRILEGCADVLVEPEDTARMTALFALSVYNPDPASTQEQGDESLTVQSLNSARGIAAEAAVRLAVNLLRIGSSLPVNLVLVLERFSEDPIPSVRLGVLKELPLIIHHQPFLGRNLFDAIFRERQGTLWANVYHILYDNYGQHFDWVAPYLERMCREGGEQSAINWARIASLATLSGHIPFEMLMTQLRDKNSAQAWKGAAEVFRGNLADHRVLCERGLQALLQLKPMPDTLFFELRQMFKNNNDHVSIAVPLGELFIDCLTPKNHHGDLHGFFSWLAFLSEQDHCSALKVCERLMRHLTTWDSLQIWNTNDLFVTLTHLSRAAEDTGDQEFISRVVALQDACIQLNIYGVDKWLQSAEQ